MAKYILKRIGYMFLTLWIIATITFVLINSIPGDPISNKAKALSPQAQTAIRKKYKLDRPLHERYVYYLSDLVHGDLGESIQYPGTKVNNMIKNEFPVSARLGLQAVVFGLMVGVVLGIISAFKRATWVDYLVMFIALVGLSVPNFVAAVLLQYGIGGKFGIPIVGWASSKASFFSGFRYTILPTIALSLPGLASNARFMRTSVLDVINQDYVLTAEAKGVSKISLVWKHILRNAMIPLVTIIGPRIATIITGAIVIESIFGIPGIGRELVNSINNRDYTVTMSLTVFFAFLYIVALLFVDLAYVLIDPRIKLEAKKG
ncbi:ABC transporter permease [Clostridium sp. DJ247]|uniref:ABC transporter permease n=1 Tax=Clostridium sp. DJ247 TaxID=2726188 RepID=UPI00162A4625|nr:ABC transporter permease [Clostridium sp. DJ247]MBC2582767.1 ABC transporter permease [Clostridium sp. DJ247]